MKKDNIIHTTAVLNKTYYHHFGINEMSASLYGNKVAEIENLKMKMSDNQEPPAKNSNIDSTKPDYWGWYDNEEQKFLLIFPAYFMLNMCFPYGMKVEEEAGKGKAYRLEIIN